MVSSVGHTNPWERANAVAPHLTPRTREGGADFVGPEVRAAPVVPRLEEARTEPHVVPGDPVGRAEWQAADVSAFPPTFAEDVVAQPLKVQFEAFLDEHRRALHDCLDDLTEEQVRRSLVPSRTTLLGLVKHATFVERVWFDEAVTCRPRREIGIPAAPDESFVLHPDDTIASVLEAHATACEDSRTATASLGLDDMLRGNRRGPLPLRWVYLHVLRELAQHCGHADILREQLLSE